MKNSEYWLRTTVIVREKKDRQEIVKSRVDRILIGSALKQKFVYWLAWLDRR